MVPQWVRIVVLRVICWCGRNRAIQSEPCERGEAAIVLHQPKTFVSLHDHLTRPGCIAVPTLLFNAPSWFCRRVRGWQDGEVLDSELDNKHWSIKQGPSSLYNWYESNHRYLYRYPNIPRHMRSQVHYLLRDSGVWTRYQTDINHHVDNHLNILSNLLGDTES